jgi:hypothetical protein
MPEWSPRLEALRDERDHLRVKLSLAENGSATNAELVEIRRQLVDLDREILRQWEKSNS